MINYIVFRLSFIVPLQYYSIIQSRTALN